MTVSVCKFVALTSALVLSMSCAREIRVRPGGNGGNGGGGGNVPTDAGVVPTADGGQAGDAGTAPTCRSFSAETAGFEQAGSSDGSLTSALAITNGRVGMVWEDVATRRVWFAVVNADGSSIVSPKVIGNNAISPDIDAADGDFVVVYHNLGIRDLVFKRFDPDGTEIVDVPLAQTIDSMAGYPKVAARGDRVLVSYFVGTGNNFEVRYARLRLNGIRIETFRRLPETMSTTALVDITTTDSGWAATWLDERHGDRRIYVARIDQGGERTGSDIMVTNGTNPNLFPTVASRGDALEICYDATIGGISKEIACAHVTADDQVVQTHTVATGDAVASFPKTLSTPDGFVVVWAAENPGIGEVFGRMIAADGSPVANNLRLTEISGTSAYPAITWLGSGLGIGWYQFSAAANWRYVYQEFPCGL